MIDDDILDMSDVLDEWSRTTRIKTVTTTTVDFVPTETVVGRNQECVIQSAQKDKLQIDTLDWSLEYIWLHSPDAIAIGELVEHAGYDFKVIAPAQWRGYGYADWIAEQVLGPMRAETP